MGMFAEAKEFLGRDPASWILKLGLETSVRTPQLRGRWLDSVICPLCPDKSGSASVVIEPGAKNVGHLHCKQCGQRGDIFDWYAKANGITPQEALAKVAELAGMPVKETRNGDRPGKADNLARHPGAMSQPILDAMKIRLTDGQEGAGARKFLHNRKINPELAAQLGVGSFGDGLIAFALHDEQTGNLRSRYRKYDPKTKSPGWSNQRSSNETRLANGFFPRNDVPPTGDATILLLEGEWDCLTARCRLRLQERGIYAFTWTGGATAVPPHSCIPTSWRGRPIWLCYDNDVFQGPNPDRVVAPEESKRARTRAHLAAEESQFWRLCHLFNSVGKLSILAVPVDPIDNYGGDFRDWVDAGGRQPEEIPRYSFEDVWSPDKDPRDVDIEEIISLPDGEFIRTVGFCQTANPDARHIFKQTQIACPMGAPHFERMCKVCSVPEKFPDKVIPWGHYKRGLYQCLSEDDPEYAIKRLVLHKPPGCNQCDISHTDREPGHIWDLSSEDNSMDCIKVVGGSPSLSSRMEVIGRVFSGRDGKSCGILASSVKEVDSISIELESYVAELKSLTPYATNDVEVIDRYLSERWLDISSNITETFEREEIHACVDLVAHSALYFRAPGLDKRVRGFLDACVFGDTRSGKTSAIRAYFAKMGLGKTVSAMGTISRAGLIVSNYEGKMRPGLWPRNHRKMVFLDEIHYWNPKFSLLTELQKARDDGWIDSAKGPGQFTIPAAVRLITGANWPAKFRRGKTYICQQLLQLYADEPQVLSRLDFAWCVLNDGTTPERTEVNHRWTTDLVRAGILRAWGQDESQIRVSRESWELAGKACAAWAQSYESEEIPLFTGIEKMESVIRTAIAVANICFSHPEGDIYSVDVRPVHVEWAIRWIEKCWDNLEYLNYSEYERGRNQISKPLEVIALLLRHFPTHIEGEALQDLMQTQDREQFLSSFEFSDYNEKQRLLPSLKKHRAFAMKSIDRSYQVFPTHGGALLLNRLIELALNDPEGYDQYSRDVQNWSANKNYVEPRDLTKDIDWDDACA